MHRAIEWFAKNSVAANLLMIGIVVAGLTTLPGIKQEIFPEVDTQLVSVSVEYRGAAPGEVEEGVCIRIEEALDGIDGVKRLRSVASEGVCVALAELFDDADASEVLDDVKTRVDAIDTFPEETEKPVIQEVEARFQVISVAVHGDVDERTRRVVADRVRDEIAALPGITHVEVKNVRPYEVSIEVSEAALRRYGLTFDEVVAAVRRSSLDLPGGSVKTEGGEILLRTQGQAERGEEFERLVLRTRPDGSRLLLGHVASVIDGFEDTDQSARFDGEPAALVEVFRVGEQNALDVAAAVHDYVAGAQAHMPAGISLTTWQDDSRLLRARRDLLVRNGQMGFVLVFLVLAVFLRLRLAFWVAIGIPISFLGALWLMPVFDVSINLLSLFAFIVVLGILVDDAIVTGENVHTHQERDPDRLRASIRGTQEVAVPVTFGVLTTVAAFAPLLFLPGQFGRLSRVIPIIVIAALLFSLVESKLVLPSHLAHGRSLQDWQPRNPVSRGWKAFQRRFADGLQWFIRDVYRPSLERAVALRYLTVSIGVAVLLLTAGFLAGGWLKFTFFPAIEGDNVVAMLTMPQGTPAEVTGRAVRQLEEAAEQVRREIDAEREEGSVFRHVLASVGEQPFGARQSRDASTLATGGNAAAHLGEVNIELAPSEDRRVKAEWVEKRWRELTGPIPDAVELVFTANLFSTGEPINVELRGASVESLRGAADELKAALARYPGVFDVADSFREGKQELELDIRPSAQALGLTLSDLATQVRQAFYGAEAQRIQRGRDDVRVMVRYPESERRSLGDVENMRIRLPDGTAVPFGEVAEAELGRGYATIRRSDRARVVNVTADVDLSQGNPNEILAAVQREELPRILADHRGVAYSLEGEQREQSDTFSGLRRGFALALVAIFALIAIPLGSYAQPLIVMSAIPFGLVGAVGGHLLLGYDLSMLSVIGIVALSGVVVNDSLVLASYVNSFRDEGMNRIRAVHEAGIARFRPVLLTSLTTFAGLTPIMLERSVQARFLIPMAISLAFGVLFATLITLLLVPCLYLILEDAKRLPRRWRARRAGRMAERTA